MTEIQDSQSLRIQILQILVQFSLSGDSGYITDDDLAEATRQPIIEVRRQLDILEAQGLTKTANALQGRRARISPEGLLAIEQLQDAAPERRRIGFEAENE